MRTQIALKDVTLYWANLRQRNDMSGKYQVDLCNLNEKQKEALEDAGISVRNKGDDRGYYITCKSKNKYKAFEIDGREIGLKGRTATSDTDDTESGVVVGNGSKAKCLVSYYDWEYNKKKGRSATLRRIVIEDLVEYSPSYEVENAL